LGIIGLMISEARVRAEITAKLDAETERADEEAKRADAETQRAEALGRWKRSAYYLKTALAHNEYRANNVTRASQLLDECPEDLRHWEWNYLKRLCHSESRTVTLGEHAGYEQAAFSADARRLALVDFKSVLHVYDTATGKETLRIPVAGKKINT